MSARSTAGLGLAVAMAAWAFGGFHALAGRDDAPRAGSGDAGVSRTVWACDGRKAVIVEGAAPDEKLEPGRARQVAALLTDLMRYCDAEITARLSVDEVVTLTVNGRTYRDYVPGSDPVVQLVHGKDEHTARERAIWQAELDRLVSEGDRLFHSDEIGGNGLACAMCHPDAANTHPETYPKFQTQLKKVALLRDMVNWCILNPLEGEELAADDPRMIALEAYILSERAGVPIEPGKH